MSAAWALIGAAAGLIAGSFLATLAIRWPQDRGLGGRSACDGCTVPVGVADLVPIISYLRLRGRCRACGAKIDPLHPVVELTCALVGAAALGLAPGWAGAFGALFGWLLVTLAALDLRHFWLPDALTAVLAAFGIIGGVAGFDPLLPDRLIGGAAGFASLWLLAFSYRRLRQREGLGGGDPKLLGAIGLWTGWQALPVILIGASLTGLFIVLVMMVAGRQVSATTRLPLGSLMAVAAFPVWLFSR